MDRRLVLVDVQRGAGDDAILQGPGERRLIHHGSARRVDEKGIALHACERRLIDQVPRLRRERHVQRHDIRGREQPVERHRFSLSRARGRGTRHVGDPHAEGGAASRHGTPEPAIPHDAELLAAQFGAQQEIKGPALPPAGADDAFGLAQPPRDGEDQREGEVRRGVGEHIGGVGDDNASRTCRRDVDVVVADRHVRDHAEVASRLDDGGIDGIDHHADQSLLAGDPAHQFVARDELASFDAIDVTHLGQAGDRRRGERAGKEDGRLQWP